ncbi:MAG: hypothetical protein ACOCP8_01275 [archaeon]
MAFINKIKDLFLPDKQTKIKNESNENDRICYKTNYVSKDYKKLCFKHAIQLVSKGQDIEAISCYALSNEPLYCELCNSENKEG